MSQYEQVIQVIELVNDHASRIGNLERADAERTKSWGQMMKRLDTLNSRALQILIALLLLLAGLVANMALHAKG